MLLVHRVAHGAAGVARRHKNLKNHSDLSHRKALTGWHMARLVWPDTGSRRGRGPNDDDDADDDESDESADAPNGGGSGGRGGR